MYFDELFLAEDICYNGGCLISPDMMKEFLFPYYEQLIANVRKRIIAKGGDAIKKHLDTIMPAMRRHGGFLPTCDHGVPEETSFENYMLYRELMKTYCD